MLTCQAIMFDGRSWFWINPFEHLTQVLRIDESRVAQIEHYNPREVRIARENPGIWIWGAERLQ